MTGVQTCALPIWELESTVKRLKVMTIVGTRPEIIKLSRVIAELDQHVDHVLVHSGQNYDYELNQVFFDQLQIRPPDRFLNAVGETPAETIGKVIALSDVAMAEERPDATLFYGDTNTCLAAISAKRSKKTTVCHSVASFCSPVCLSRKRRQHSAPTSAS